ncbi:MAG: hypothetical protein P3M73_00030 [Candidatus Hodgkinia cicadicola]|nr:MAG: hypothetical protein P3M73_00030 [Candidatus Hodgkinia cicadicola]
MFQNLVQAFRQETKVFKHILNCWLPKRTLEKYNLTASNPKELKRALGLTTLFLVLDIFRPKPSQTTGCTKTTPKGRRLRTRKHETSAIFTIQKKIMSKPVKTIPISQADLSCAVLLGQPKHDKHHKAEENHVSKTSASALILCTKSPEQLRGAASQSTK